MFVRDASGTSRTVAGIQVRDAGNALRTVAAVQVRDAAGLHSVLSGTGSDLSVSPQYANGSGYSKATITVTTNVVTITAPVGSTFSWGFADLGFTASAPTSASTSFSARVAPGADVSTTATCTVNSPSQIATIDVSVDISNNYGI